jgi:hypothetical protein
VKVLRVLATHVDLTGLWTDPIAMTLVLRARGQLNCAYRANGLQPSDAFSAGDVEPLSRQDGDDPAASGLAAARARWPGAFDGWASAMPTEVAAAVLTTLFRTRERLTNQPNSPPDLMQGLAVACDYLLEACDFSEAP